MKTAALLCGLLILAASLSPTAWGQENLSGLDFTLFPAAEPPYPVYALGSPVELLLVMENATRWPINTERGFSQLELYQSLIVTDPSGKRHRPRSGEISSTMPPPFFWNSKETVPAEVLPVGWVRSVAADLIQLFPMMAETPGWYTVEAEQPFRRFAWAVDIAGLGLLGVVDADPKSWQGSVASQNKLRLFVAAEGAQFRVRVRDLDPQTQTPYPGQVPVKVFRSTQIGAVPVWPDVWTRENAVLSGVSDFQGWVVWDAGRACVPKKDTEDYVAVGRYLNEYQVAVFEAADENWRPNCLGVMERRLFFREPEEKFAVYASNSLYVRNKVNLLSGMVGAPNASVGPWLNSDVEVSIGENVYAEDGVKIIGDSVLLRSTAHVYDVFYNDLQDKGATVEGLLCDRQADDCNFSPWVNSLTLPPPSPGTDKKRNLVVGSDEIFQLEPIEDPQPRYYDLVMDSNSTLILAEGTHHFQNVRLGSGATILCNGPVILTVKGFVFPGTKAYFGPKPESSGLDAADIFLYAPGKNGKKGEPVVEIGEGNEIQANVYAPNGTLATGEGCVLTGSFVGKDVSVGMKSTVTEKSGF